MKLVECPQTRHQIVQIYTLLSNASKGMSCHLDGTVLHHTSLQRITHLSNKDPIQSEKKKYKIGI